MINQTERVKQNQLRKPMLARWAAQRRREGIFATGVNVQKLPSPQATASASRMLSPGSFPGNFRFLSTDSMSGFWNRFKARTKQRGTSLNYDYRPHRRKSNDFFSGWWPFKLLFWPIWLGWKLLKRLLILRS
jgi:hypothetical protein